MDLIVLSIFLISLLVLVLIVFKKIPVLANLKPAEAKAPILGRIKHKIKKNGFSKGFSFEMILHNVLSKFRIITLKTENKTSDWLTGLRKRAIEKKEKFQDDYWKRLKK